MKTAAAIAATIAVAHPALAATGATPGGSGLLVGLFLALGALVVATQLIPALTLFASLVASLFAGHRVERAAAAGEGAEAR